MAPRSVPAGLAPIATGAEYDPEEPGLVGSLEKHGNPNMVTDDKEYRGSPNRLLDQIIVFVVERCFELRPLLILRQIFAERIYSPGVVALLHATQRHQMNNPNQGGQQNQGNQKPGQQTQNPGQGGQQGGHEQKPGQQTQTPGQGGQQGDRKPGQQTQK